MNEKLPLSVFIIAKDEADRIGRAINSVREWVDEVIVIDSGSTDGTVEVARALGARTTFRQWEGYGPQKVYGETLCRNDWLLNIDADEEISPALVEEIRALFAEGKTPIAWGYKLLIKRLSRFTGKLYRLAPYHDPIRLYHKAHARFKDSTVHDSVVMKNPAEKTPCLKHIVYHHSFRSYTHAIEKINRYSTMQAEDMLSRGRVPAAARIIVEPFAAFLKAYFLRRYIFFGIEGIIEAWIFSFARTLRLVKALEMAKHKEPNL